MKKERPRIDWLARAKNVSEYIENPVTSIELINLIQKVIGCNSTDARNVIAAGENHYFFWMGEKWYGRKSVARYSRIPVSM